MKRNGKRKKKNQISYMTDDISHHFAGLEGSIVPFDFARPCTP
jgi:hypothetical protein